MQVRSNGSNVEPLSAFALIQPAKGSECHANVARDKMEFHGFIHFHGFMSNANAAPFVVRVLKMQTIYMLN